MYSFTTRSKKAEKQFYNVLQQRPGIKKKLEELKEDPSKKLHAHRLKGKLEGLCSCYLGGDIRLVYKIDEQNKEIVVFSAGSHKQAYK